MELASPYRSGDDVAPQFVHRDPCPGPQAEDRRAISSPDEACADEFLEAPMHWAEFALALTLFVATLPLLAVAVALVKLSSRGPAIYRQIRVGYRGRPFTIYKV